MRRKLAWIAAGVAVLVLCAFLFAPLLARVDAGFVARHKEPVFCWSRWLGSIVPATGLRRGLMDGGTQFYDGFGYTLTWKHSIAPLQYAAGERAQFDTGVVVRFYLPWYNRFDFQTSARETRCPDLPNI
jgi:hypothetical protein